MLLITHSKVEAMDPDILIFRYQFLQAAKRLFSQKMKVASLYPEDLVRDMRRLYGVIFVELAIMRSIEVKKAVKNRKGVVVKMPFMG